MLVIDFGTGFDFNIVDAKKLDGYILCRVPVDYEITVDGKRTRLIDAPAFDCLQKQSGIVVVDLQEKTHFGETVSVLPQRYSAAGYVDALFDLPVGSITQRTLTWAFRVHQERPACTQGIADPTLMDHADRQSTVQAQSNSMFHSSSFPGSFEIVAQSGSGGGNLADVAIDLVNIWRSWPRTGERPPPPGPDTVSTCKPTAVRGSQRASFNKPPIGRPIPAAAGHGFRAPAR